VFIIFIEFEVISSYNFLYIERLSGSNTSCGKNVALSRIFTDKKIESESCVHGSAMKKRKKTFEIWTHRTRGNPSGRRDGALSFQVAVTTMRVQMRRPLLPSNRSSGLQAARGELSLLQHSLRSSAMRSNELRPLILDKTKKANTGKKKTPKRQPRRCLRNLMPRQAIDLRVSLCRKQNKCDFLEAPTL
jgi:hypothetical protein